MSKKNQKHKVKPDNGYPLPQRTVLYSHKKHMQPVPEVGKKYHCFDDGKITFSRHYIIEVTEVLGHNAFKKKYPEMFQTYLDESRQCYWLYSRSSDKFIICHAKEDRQESFDLEVAVRTKQGGWFTIGKDSFYCGTFDVTGKLWDELISDIDQWNYTEEEKKRILEENTI